MRNIIQICIFRLLFSLSLLDMCAITRDLALKLHNNAIESNDNCDSYDFSILFVHCRRLFLLLLFSGVSMLR